MYQNLNSLASLKSPSCDPSYFQTFSFLVLTSRFQNRPALLLTTFLKKKHKTVLLRIQFQCDPFSLPCLLPQTEASSAFPLQSASIPEEKQPVQFDSPESVWLEVEQGGESLIGWGGAPAGLQLSVSLTMLAASLTSQRAQCPP